MGERAVMGVLGRHGLAEGRYAAEDENAMEWLAREAADVYQAILAGGDPAVILVNTGWWMADEGPFPDALRDELVTAAGVS